MGLFLLIGNKSYSSWSFRPWLAMKVAGIPFAEEVISLDAANFRERVRAISPTGKVPCLIDGENHVWESLAILEHLAEKHPQAGLWPADESARAHARSIAAEMHAGFSPLRQHYPMNLRRAIRHRKPTAEVVDNISRIDAMWSDCRARFGRGGPFLFGAFGAADAMYAPVVSRFHTYAVEVGRETRAYMDAMMALPAWGEWCAAALQEPWILPQYDVD
ncbi:MAG TPA: glutathione S-transferase family protein [Xanthobacteraceae bacterium]|nr:glutathione S-transferase family protein [Xanthobacteraceae bacterium]